MGLFGRKDAGASANGERWLVVGLGNPSAEYGGTRHNVGADAVARLAERLGTRLKPHKAGAQVADVVTRPASRPAPGSGAAQRLTLVLPFGFMNNSGGPVQQVLAFYKVPTERLVVVHDDLDLPPAALRLKRGGGSGGHNGLKDITRRIGTPDYYRVRIGIGRPPGRQDPADFVLKRFPTKEREEIDVTLEQTGDAILHLIDEGLEAAQNRFH